MTAYIFDTEATDKDAPEIIEAAWIRMPVVADLVGPSDRIDVGPLSPYQTYEERFRPARSISFGAMAVHHILPQDLIGSRPSTAFELPADVEYLVGHSIDFDWQAAGSPSHVKRICTHALAQHLFADSDSLSLSALLYFTGGPTDYVRSLVKQAHGAMQDCWNVMHLLREILAKRPDVQTWSQLWELSEQYRVPLKMPLGRNRGALLTEIEDSEIRWYLRQDWIDPYFRKGLIQVLRSRRAPSLFDADADQYEDEQGDA